MTFLAGIVNVLTFCGFYQHTIMYQPIISQNPLPKKEAVIINREECVQVLPSLYLIFLTWHEGNVSFMISRNRLLAQAMNNNLSWL
jgi:hypothetical protein